MKRFLSVFLLMVGLVVAGGANAAPVTWTIPATTLSGNGIGSISGTFVYDAATNTTSSINISMTNNGVAYPLTVAASNAGGYVRFVVANTVGQQGAYILSSGLTNAGGSLTLAANDIGTGPCTSLTSGLCDNIGGPGGTNTSPVIVSGTATSAVPTLSEWAQLMLALMVIGIAWHFHNNRQNSY